MPRPRSDIEPRIVAAARERFLADGVDGASLRAIAAAAGTSIGMVYYYFPTKDELFLAVVEERYEKLVADLATALAPELPVKQRLERMFERFAAISGEELEVLRLVVREALVSSDRLNRIIERFMRGHVPLIVRTVFDGLADGTFDRSLHPMVVALATVALAGPAQVIRAVAGEKLPLPFGPGGKELAHQLVGVLLSGVGAKAPKGRR
jgi:AcrR family transcriptional regulator